ncbi:hypothetical protein [Pseudomonas sp. C9-3]|uniref:hypothetical protein n=1 Tax=Pseudomonas sp. C9-3 TaxID=3078264 RepID=UPI0028E7E6B3|nr:hypothetical protein [Pseudomonas sp. C9-3]
MTSYKQPASKVKRKQTIAPSQKKNENFPTHPELIPTEDTKSFLFQIRQILESKFIRHWGNLSAQEIRKKEASLASFCEKIEEISKSKEIKWKEILSCYYWSKSKEGEKKGILRKHFFYATLYYLEAKEALKKQENKKTDRAFTLASHSAYHIGIIEGYEHRLIEEQARSLRGKIGNKVSQSNREKTKKHLEALLRSPPKRWPDIIKTAILLSPAISDFRESLGAPPPKWDPSQFIINEISKAGSIKNAYDENCLSQYRQNRISAK